MSGVGSTEPPDNSGELLLRAGSWQDVTPESANWRYLSFGTRTGSFSAETGEFEIALVPLSGRFHVESGDGSWELGGREHVFAGLPWALYLPRDSSYRVEGDGELALCGARCERRRDPRLVTPDDVEIEVRGAGNATRQINHLLKPDFPAERLLVVEVFTPSGNWSSYPPHKHDTDNLPSESYLEETYYHRTARPEGFAVQMVYTDDRSLNEALQVRDGNVVLVPRGYHPVAAGPGCDLYYLNVMAGPHRRWVVTTDPDHRWRLD
jgi:5-deoxy-glucuronate isomerase